MRASLPSQCLQSHPPTGPLSLPLYSWMDTKNWGVGVFKRTLPSASHCTCSYARTWKPGVASPSSSSLEGHPPVPAPVEAQPMSICPHPTLAQPTLTTPAFLALVGSAANGHWVLCFVAHKSCFSPHLLKERQWKEPVSMYAMHALGTAGLKGLSQRNMRPWGIQWKQSLTETAFIEPCFMGAASSRADPCMQYLIEHLQ